MGRIQQAMQRAAQCVRQRPATQGRLAGKLALVTGSAQGLGLGIARQLHQEGASVVIADINHEQAAQVAAQLGEYAYSVAVDIADPASVEEMMIRVVEYMGGLDLLVANAGVVKAGSLEEMTPENFEFVTRINYTGYFLCVKYAAMVMKAQYEADPAWWGDIVQINSKSGLTGSKNNFAYAGGKFGGIGLTQSFALELAPYNIKVNAICPGNFYDGPLWSDPERGLFVQYLRAGKVPGAKTIEDVRRFYTQKSLIPRGCYPEDVSRAVFYCVEQMFETGQAIPVTGGQSMLK